MPWPKDHKAQTRKRIVEAAAAAFRERGVSGVRVEEIMSAAGLTHGGFYSHFRSKDALVKVALERAAEETLERLGSSLDSQEGMARLLAVADAYLSPEHAAHPGKGCPVAALGPEVSRAGGKSREELATGLRRRLAWMKGLVPKRRGRAYEEQVVGTLACMIGGVILSRILGGDEGLEALESCRGFLRHTLEEPRERA